MHEIRRVGIEGFRRLRDVSIDMRPMMVMVGANGCGKTSFMDALALLASSAEGGLNRRLTDMGGVSETTTRGRQQDMSFSADMEVPDHNPLKYGMSIAAQGHTYSVSQESLTQTRPGYSQPFKHIESTYRDIRYFDTEEGRLLRPNWQFNYFESSLSQVPKLFREAEELRRSLSAVTQYHVLDVGIRAPVKLPQQLRPVDLPGENGENLVPFLFNIRETNSDKYEAIQDTLRVAYPGFDSLNFPIAAAGMMSMTWKEKAFQSPIYIHQLSEGTLRFLWLISLLQSPGLTTITMIDEPEVSLHPELLAILAELMREASRKTQIIVATHSDRLIRFLETKEVVVMDIKEDGGTSMTWADTLDLDAWLADYTLDEVWQMGRMGARA